METLVPSSDAERDRARKYKSTQSLHDLGLDNYPNPEYPESSRLSRKEEKGALQNLNNRLASKRLFINYIAQWWKGEVGHQGSDIHANVSTLVKSY